MDFLPVAVAEVVTAFLLAIMLGGMAYVLKNPGPWGRFWIFCMVLFLAMWAAGLWIRPVSPASTVRWQPMLFTGVFFALFLSVLTPIFRVRPPDIPAGIDFLEQQHLARQYDEELEHKQKALTTLLLILLGVFSVAILSAYLVLGRA